jgi:hypothetical protein
MTVRSRKSAKKLPGEKTESRGFGEGRGLGEAVARPVGTIGIEKKPA